MKEHTILYTLDLIRHHEQLRNNAISMSILLASNTCLLISHPAKEIPEIMICWINLVFIAVMLYTAYRQHKTGKKLREAYYAGE